MEPEPPGLSDITDGHVAQSAAAHATDDIDGDQDRNADKCESTEQDTISDVKRNDNKNE